MMKPTLADVAAERLANANTDEPVMAEDEVLARIARREKPGERLRAVELIGKHLGMFRESNEPADRLTLEMLVPKFIPRPELLR